MQAFVRPVPDGTRRRPASAPKAKKRDGKAAADAAHLEGVKAAVFTTTAIVIAAILYVWCDRREEAAERGYSASGNGLGGDDLAALRDQRLKKIGQSHLPSSPARQPSPAATAQPPCRRRAPHQRWRQHLRPRSGLKQQGRLGLRRHSTRRRSMLASGSAHLTTLKTTCRLLQRSRVLTRELWAAGAGLVQRPAAGGPAAASGTDRSGAASGGGAGGPEARKPAATAPARALARAGGEHQLATSGGRADASAPSQPRSGTGRRSLRAPTRRGGARAVRRGRRHGAAGNHRGQDPASLHLVKDVCPSRALFDVLQNDGEFDGDGDGVVAIRVSTRSPQSAFWLHELAVSSPAVMLLWGTHGVESFRPRSLAAATLAAAIKRATVAANEPLTTWAAMEARARADRRCWRGTARGRRAIGGRPRPPAPAPLARRRRRVRPGSSSTRRPPSTRRRSRRMRRSRRPRRRRRLRRPRRRGGGRGGAAAEAKELYRLANIELRRNARRAQGRMLPSSRRRATRRCAWWCGCATGGGCSGVSNAPIRRSGWSRGRERGPEFDGEFAPSATTCPARRARPRAARRRRRSRVVAQLRALFVEEIEEEEDDTR